MKTQDQRIEQLEQQQKEILDLLNKMLDSRTFSEDTEICINTKGSVMRILIILSILSLAFVLTSCSALTWQALQDFKISESFDFSFDKDDDEKQKNDASPQSDL